MKLKKYILLFLSIIAVFIALGYQIQHQVSPKWSIYDSLYAKIWYGLSIAIAIPVIWFSIKFFKRTNNRTYLLPCLIVGMGIIIIATNTILISQKEESPSVLKAEYDGSTHWLALNLKADGTYHMNNHNSYKGGEYYNGTYRMKDDSIVLEKDISLGGLCMSKNWIIKQDSIFFDLFFPETKEVDRTEYFIIKNK